MKVDTNEVQRLLNKQKGYESKLSLKTDAIVDPLHQTFDGLTSDTRQLLQYHLNQNNGVTDKELLMMLDERLSEVNELNRLKRERATLSVESLISKGIIDFAQKEIYIKLATNNYELTLEIACEQHNNRLELECMLMLSNDELYMSGKLERLKELSPAVFQEKHKQIFGVEYKQKN